MTLYPIDTIRNASIDQGIELILEDVREELILCPVGVDVPGTIDDIIEVYDMARPRLNVLAGFLQGNRDLFGADISTGLGFLPVILQRFGAHIIGTERDPSVSYFAVAHGVDVLRYHIGVDVPPLERASLDFLVFAEVLEHIKFPAVAVLRELIELLKPGGVFIITTPNIARLQHVEALIAGENFLEPFPEDVPWGRDATDFIEHVREYSIREIVEAVEAVGLVVTHLLTTGWGDAGYNPLPNPYANEICVVAATK